MWDIILLTSLQSPSLCEGMEIAEMLTQFSSYILLLLQTPPLNIIPLFTQLSNRLISIVLSNLCFHDNYVHTSANKTFTSLRIFPLPFLSI